jgi:hypothetical protein
MENYLGERALLFSAQSELSCPETCERHGCREPELPIPVTVVDLVGISWISGHTVPCLLVEYCKFVFDPVAENHPWVGHLSFEFRKKV